jgi:hemolysin-activating ACP:hemolysin acyltransferase
MARANEAEKQFLIIADAAHFSENDNTNIFFVKWVAPAGHSIRNTGDAS